MFSLVRLMGAGLTAIIIGLGFGNIGVAATGNAPLSPASSSGSGAPQVVRQLVVLSPGVSYLNVVEDFRFQGSDPNGFRISLPPGYAQLGTHGVDPKKEKVVNGTLVVPPDTSEATLTFDYPLLANGIKVPFVVYYPTAVFIAYTAPGLYLPTGDSGNPGLTDMGQQVVQGMPYERYASKPLDIGASLVIQVANGNPSGPGGQQGGSSPRLA